MDNENPFNSPGFRLLVGILVNVITVVATVVIESNVHHQPNFLSLQSITYAHAGPCLNHSGAHRVFFLKEDRTGFLRGTVPISFADEGERIDVLYGSDGTRWLRKAGSFPIREPPPE